ncbi:MAG: hypothetical protein DRJ42_13090 [Deltaproteobacteria bacterium]|nr:MAG: hypothetical protein DRJ42_13090 [Deltaproteobacteria bacterium]
MALLRWSPLLFVLCLGCTAAPRGLEWELSVADGEVESRAVALEAEILAGDCNSAVVLHRSVTRLDETPPAPPQLSPGVHAFRARLVDTECVPIAEGCIQVSLPLEDGAQVVVQLQGTATGSAGCLPGRCNAGICGGGDTDSGTGVDSGARPDSAILVDSSMPDAAPDSMVPVDTGPACTPGLCQICGATGPQAPVDDEACGTIDCDDLDSYSVEGSASPTGTNHRRFRDYEDITVERCGSLGVCLEPNTNETCTVVSESRVDSCGTCKRATTSGCSNYADGTGCGTDSRCYGGVCATACDTGNSGSVSCSTLCGWCRGTCRGATTRSGGTELGCGMTGQSSTCYCTY